MLLLLILLLMLLFVAFERQHKMLHTYSTSLHTHTHPDRCIPITNAFDTDWWVLNVFVDDYVRLALSLLHLWKLYFKSFYIFVTNSTLDTRYDQKLFTSIHHLVFHEKHLQWCIFLETFFRLRSLHWILSFLFIYCNQHPGDDPYSWRVLCSLKENKF